MCVLLTNWLCEYNNRAYNNRLVYDWLSISITTITCICVCKRRASERAWSISLYYQKKKIKKNKEKKNRAFRELDELIELDTAIWCVAIRFRVGYYYYYYYIIHDDKCVWGWRGMGEGGTRSNVVWPWWTLGFSGTAMEPPLPRRKKCPELAYRTHEFIPTNAHDAGGIDGIDSNVVADKVRVSLIVVLLI